MVWHIVKDKSSPTSGSHVVILLLRPPFIVHLRVWPGRHESCGFSAS